MIAFDTSIITYINNNIFRISSYLATNSDPKLVPLSTLYSNQLAFHKFRQSLYLRNSRGFKIASAHVLTKSYYLYIYVLFFAFAEAETLNIAPACVSSTLQQMLIRSEYCEIGLFLCLVQ